MNKPSADTYIPLRERKEEIIPLVLKNIKETERLLNIPAKGLSKEAEEYLENYEWPGNEDELKRTVRRACILSDEEDLQAEDFDLTYRKAHSIGRFVETRLKGFMKNIKKFERFNLYDMVIPEVEKALIQMVLNETGGNQIKTARLLGINRNTLRSKIRRLGIRIKKTR